MDTIAKQNQDESLPKTVHFSNHLLSLNQELENIKKRFENNYLKYSYRKYEEKRNLYIRLTRAKSKLARLSSKSIASSEDLIIMMKNTHFEINELKNFENSLYKNS